MSVLTAGFSSTSHRIGHCANRDRHTILGPSSGSCDLVQLFDQSPTTPTPHPPPSSCSESVYALQPT